MIAGFVGFLLMMFGAVALIITRAEIAATGFLICGFVLFAIPALGPSLSRMRLKLAGQEFELHPGRDPSELSKGIEQLRDEKPDPTDAELPGQVEVELHEQVWWGPARYLLGETALMAILDKLDGPLTGCRAQVYLYDDAENLLMPAYPAHRIGNGREGPRGWRVAEGLTGAAYAHNEYTYFDRSVVREDGWGISDEVLNRYKDVTAVAAAPLIAKDGTVLGVLTLYSTSPATRLTTPFGRQEHLALAQQVSVCVVDLLWAAAPGG